MRRRLQSIAVARATLGGICFLAAISFPGTGLAEELFVSKQLTPGGEYNKGIEGPRSTPPATCSWSASRYPAPIRP